MNDVPFPDSGIPMTKEYRMKPDWNTLTNIPYAQGHAQVMVNLYEENGDPSPVCPRLFLKRMTDEAAKKGIYIKAGFENEFILLQRTTDGSVKPVDDTVYASTLSMDINCDVMTDILDALFKQGIDIELYHPEAANGQQEISIRYSDVLTAADQQVIVRETVKAVALKHNMIATFLPKVFQDQAGNGTHIHLSLHTKDGKNIVPSETKNDEISEVTGHFIAGMLEHLNGLMAISVPTTNSLRRIAPCFWSGAFKIWGYGNREAAIRVPSNACKPNPTHFELKTSDACGNPYFVLGAVIAAGMDGIKRNLPIPPPYQDDPGVKSEEELKKNNIVPFPRTVDLTTKALEEDKVLTDALGPKLTRLILAIRRFEFENMKNLSLEEERNLLMTRF